MKERIIRWVGRALGVLSIAVTVYAAVGLLFETLISNMDRFYAVMACVVFVAAAIAFVRLLLRVYFAAPAEARAHDLSISLTIEQGSAPDSVPEAAASGGERQSEQAAGKVMWL